MGVSIDFFIKFTIANDAPIQFTYPYVTGCSPAHVSIMKNALNLKNARAFAAMYCRQKDKKYCFIQTYANCRDLLLHDMGPDLADGRRDYLANEQEWRTAPLWGIGLTHKVSADAGFMHDGRARNLQEAIMWHGGEAASARETFRNMTKDERAALLLFLESI